MGPGLKTLATAMLLHQQFQQKLQETKRDALKEGKELKKQQENMTPKLCI